MTFSHHTTYSCVCLSLTFFTDPLSVVFEKHKSTFYETMAVIRHRTSPICLIKEFSFSILLLSSALIIVYHNTAVSYYVIDTETRQQQALVEGGGHGDGGRTRTRTRTGGIYIPPSDQQFILPFDENVPSMKLAKPISTNIRSGHIEMVAAKPTRTKRQVSNDDGSANQYSRFYHPTILNLTMLDQPEKNPFLTQEHWLDMANLLARPFGRNENENEYEKEQIVDHHYHHRPTAKEICSWAPLLEASESNPFVYQSPPEGFLYVQLPKAASSSFAAINARIAIRQGQRQGHFPNRNGTTTTTTRMACTHEERHTWSVKRLYGNRNRQKSFLWTSIRDPASRALSRIGIGRQNRTDEKIIMLLQKLQHPQWGTVSQGQGGFQLNYLSWRTIPPYLFWTNKTPLFVKYTELVQLVITELLREYDFIALTERMDESLVVLQLLLNLPLGDILSVSSNLVQQEGTDDDTTRSKCQPNDTDTILSPVVQAYLQSDDWYAPNYGDYVLYAVVNASLDQTIQLLGSQRVDKALQRYRHAKQIVQERCGNDTHANMTIDPCWRLDQTQLAKQTQRTDCYLNGEGCGYSCIDELEAQGLLG